MPQQIRLINRSGKKVSAGVLVKIYPNPKFINAFDVAKAGEAIIGVTSSYVAPGQGCLINLMNTVRWEDILNKPTISESSGGESAYEIAVRLGFSGTEAQWIASLAGRDGNDGSPGLPGVPGEHGIPGSPGGDGKDGREIEVQKGATYIQWRYAGDTEWINLIAIADLKGNPGEGSAYNVLINDWLC